MKIIRNVILTIGVFFFVLYLITPYSVFGASYNHTVFVSTDTRFDSSIVVVYADGVFSDSSTITADTTYSLEDDSSYSITKVDFWDGVAYGYPDPAVFLKSSATATISTADKADIASFTNDTLTAQHGAGSWSASTGSGAVTVRIQATDTTGTDSILTADVTVTIRTLGGVLDAVQTTNSGGYADFTLPSDSMVIYGYRSGYLWYTDTIVVSVQDTVILYGKNIFSTASLCVVYGWLKNAQNNPVYGAVVTGNRTTSRYAVDSYNPVIIPNTSVYAITDTLGYFELLLRTTGSYSDTTKGFYNISSTYGGSEIFSVEKLYIPDIGTLSLADSLAGR